jgi:hypothetical protein
MRIVVEIDNAALRDAPRAVSLAARGVLFGVVLLNMLIMRNYRAMGKPLPKLYRSGVKFAPEPNAGEYEDFADCLSVLRRRWGDCDDLVAYRVAELRESGEDPKATIKIYWRDFCEECNAVVREGQKRCFRCGCENTHRVYHAQVRRGNKKSKDGRGVVEDPARLLGM